MVGWGDGEAGTVLDGGWGPPGPEDCGQWREEVFKCCWPLGQPEGPMEKAGLGARIWIPSPAVPRAVAAPGCPGLQGHHPAAGRGTGGGRTLHQKSRSSSCTHPCLSRCRLVPSPLRPPGHPPLALWPFSSLGPQPSWQLPPPQPLLQPLLLPRAELSLLRCSGGQASRAPLRPRVLHRAGLRGRCPGLLHGHLWLHRCRRGKLQPVAEPSKLQLSSSSSLAKLQKGSRRDFSFCEKGHKGIGQR